MRLDAEKLHSDSKIAGFKVKYWKAIRRNKNANNNNKLELMVIAKNKKSFHLAAWRIDDVFVKIVKLSIHFCKLLSRLVFLQHLRLIDREQNKKLQH